MTDDDAFDGFHPFRKSLIRGVEAVNDAPDIPPALSAEEWRKRFTVRPGPAHVIFYEGQRSALCVGQQTTAGPVVVLQDVNDLAALIALANAEMRRFDDPRAILREHVTLLREVADAYEHDTAGIGDDRSDRVREFADALESYLPPTESLTSETPD